MDFFHRRTSCSYDTILQCLTPSWLGVVVETQPAERSGYTQIVKGKIDFIYQPKQKADVATNLPSELVGINMSTEPRQTH